MSVGEELREVAAIGDELKLRQLLMNCDQSIINSCNALNKWTALHWASKRGHSSIVKLLLERGADPTLITANGQTALSLATNPNVRQLLGGTKEIKAEPIETAEALPIVPNYLAHPVFPYASNSYNSSSAVSSSNSSKVLDNSLTTPTTHDCQKLSSSSSQGNLNNVAGKKRAPSKEITVKIRVADLEDDDYIEVDIQPECMDYAGLLAFFCKELNVDPKDVYKIRKRPNVVVRNDRDVARITSLDNFELVLYDE